MHVTQGWTNEASGNTALAVDKNDKMSQEEMVSSSSPESYISDGDIEVCCLRIQPISRGRQRQKCKEPESRGNMPRTLSTLDFSFPAMLFLFQGPLSWVFVT